VTVSVSTEETEGTGQHQHGDTETRGIPPTALRAVERELRPETQAPLAPEAFVFLVSTPLYAGRKAGVGGMPVHSLRLCRALARDRFSAYVCLRAPVPPC